MTLRRRILHFSCPKELMTYCNEALPPFDIHQIITLDFVHRSCQKRRISDCGSLDASGFQMSHFC